MKRKLSQRALELYKRVRLLESKGLINDNEYKKDKQELIKLYSQRFFEDVKQAQEYWEQSDIYMEIALLKQAAADAAFVLKLIERKSE